MKAKQLVCIIDEDPQVQKGWSLSLGNDADSYCYNNHLELFNAASSNKDLIPSFSCIIVGRYFKSINLDIVSSNVTELIKEQGAGPILLNWQGYITKEEVNANFDGKLFHRYGVKWQTLRLRIQKYEKSLQPNLSSSTDESTKLQENTESFNSIRTPKPIFENVPRPDRCVSVLKMMAKNSSGQHQEKINFYLKKDPKTGVRLLEAIYEKLLTDKSSSESCPSRYINSSPLVAKRILKEALF